MIKLRHQMRIVEQGNSKRAVLTNPTRGSSVGAKANVEMASVLSGSMFGSSRSGMVMNALPQGGMLWDGYLSHLIGENEHANMRFYVDIHAYDPIAGSLVDLMATMPFSDYVLIGTKDKQRLSTYDQAIELLNMKSLFPEIAVDYMVKGAHVSTLMYDRHTHKFTDLIPWRNEDCTVDLVPQVNLDPVIHVTPSREYQHYLFSDKGPQIFRENGVRDNIMKSLSVKSLDLDPLTTLWIPRKTFSTDMRGTSMLKRVLPIYLIEKTLYRGTLVEAGRRQRALLHVAMGDDTWEPTPEEMQAVTSLFMQADLDPLGPVIATRQGIQPTEMRCLSGDTIVCTDQGLKRIDSLVDNGKEYAQRTSVPVNFRVKGYDGKFKRVKEWHYQGKLPGYKFTFKSGNDITCTLEHEHLTVGAYGELVLVKSKDLTEKSLVCVDRRGHATNHIHKLELSWPDIDAIKYGIPASIFVPVLISRVLGTSKIKDGGGTWFENDDGKPVFLEDGWATIFRHYTHANSPMHYATFDAGGYSKELGIIRKVSKRLYSNLMILFKLKYSFDSIVDSEYVGKLHMYDLSMEDEKHPLFVANGIVTKNSGGDFWKFTDIIDTTNGLKMRALGVSDAFLSSDAAYNAMDISLSVMVENLRNFREHITYNSFTSKIFPLIAEVNKFYKEKGEPGVNPSELAGLNAQRQRKLNDRSKYDMPFVHWRKPLRPESDSQYLEVLGSLKDKGMPIPMSMLAMSAGIDIDALIKDLEQDVEIQKKLAAIEAQLQPANSQDGGEGMPPGMQMGSMESMLREVLGKRTRPILGREFQTEYATETPTGKRRYVYRQKEARDKAYDQLHKSVKQLAKEGEHGIKVRLDSVYARLGKIPRIG